MKLRLLIISLLICSAGFSQKVDFMRKMADKYYQNFDFHKAIPLYEQLLKSSPANYEVHVRLATIYDHLNDSQSGEKYYAFLVDKKNAKPEYLLNYARILAKNGKYDQAVIWYQKYSKVQSSDTRGIAFAEAYKNMAAFYKDSSGVRLVKTPFSTQADDFSPAYYGGSIVFSSDRQRSSFVGSTYNWTQSPYLDLYIAAPDEKEAKPFSKELNTPYHEGPVTFNRTQDTIFFTRSIYYNSRLFESSEGIIRLGLFQASWDAKQKKWIDVKPLSLNNVQYSVEHPALSPDGKKLYFASDMFGGHGEMDLYVSRWITDGNGMQGWSAAENLGPGINSSGNDLFPFVDGQGDLWYASEGIPGLGGLDILFAPKSIDGFSGTINPGYPMNTRFDDFGYITDSNGENGYLSSDRNNAPGNDDIYSIHRPFRKHLIQAVDASTRQPLSAVKIKVMEDGAAPVMMESNAASPAILHVNPLKNYQFASTKEKYMAGRLELTREEIHGMDTIKILMNPAGVFVKLIGLVYAATGKAPLSNCTVNLLNQTNGMGLKLRTDDQGSFNRQLLGASDYKISISDLPLQGKCNTAEIALSTKGIERDTVINLSIPVYCEGDVIAMEDIYYDLNKYNIRPDAAKVLDKLLKIMKDYPKMQIELRSHTDSRGTAASNMTLSNNRARSAAEYLYTKGIQKGRIIGKGYGETMLINKCADGVPCSDAEHQLNRRTEFKILKMEGQGLEIVEGKDLSFKNIQQGTASKVSKKIKSPIVPPALDKQELAASKAAADKQARAEQQATERKTSFTSTPAKLLKYIKIDRDGKFFVLLDPVKHEYFVQTGAFKKKENAENLVKAHQNLIPYTAVVFFDEGFFKVRFGPFKSSAEYTKCVNIILENKKP
jgi:outer membrane protein OmpA-like peptidoglycan-associated protein/tetratricopeptide (TPR) repeat protein